MTISPRHFAFARFVDSHTHMPFVAVIYDGRAVPVTVCLEDLPATVMQVSELFENWDDSLDRIEAWLDAHADHIEKFGQIETDLNAVSPVSPTQIFQAAANYRKHVIDLMVASPRPEHVGRPESELRAFATELMDKRAASGKPTVFQGLPSSITGPFDDVVIPHITEQCDWELELAAVMLRPTRFVSPSEALSSVAGYTIVNDISMRDWLYPTGDSSRGADWLACKGAPTFLPVGPYLVPARYVKDPNNLHIELKLNGDIMQSESTHDMIFDVASLIAHTSTFALMLPGDLLLTGSPSGNGVHHGRFLTEGDVLEGSIEGLGTQINHLVNEPVARP